MWEKRVTLILGHYGSGKTNIAVNLALALKKTRDKVAIADLDIVNPYFRTKDSLSVINEAGIRLISSEYANTNLDIPALPQDMYAVTDDKSLTCVLDIGGDDRGALVLGRLRPALVAEGDYEMLLVVNKYRPLTKDAASALEVMAEIEAAANMRFTGIVNNSNLGAETTAETVLSSLEYAREIARLTSLPIVMTTVREDLVEELQGKAENLFPLTLQKNFIESKI
ncbi:MAG: hypothetical protein IJT69_00595 [Clostridia bacterium]|nr:hypothetical protein [Clostridia bacterium]